MIQLATSVNSLAAWACWSSGSPAPIREAVGVGPFFLPPTFFCQAQKKKKRKGYPRSTIVQSFTPTKEKMEPPAKKSRKLLDDSSSDDSGDESGGVTLNTSGDKDFKIKVNEEYARRFEYNKKREELAKRKSDSIYHLFFFANRGMLYSGGETWKCC